MGRENIHPSLTGVDQGLAKHLQKVIPELTPKAPTPKSDTDPIFSTTTIPRPERVVPQNSKDEHEIGGVFPMPADNDKVRKAVAPSSGGTQTYRYGDQAFHARLAPKPAVITAEPTTVVEESTGSTESQTPPTEPVAAPVKAEDVPPAVVEQEPTKTEARPAPTLESVNRTVKQFFGAIPANAIPMLQEPGGLLIPSGEGESRRSVGVVLEPIMSEGKLSGWTVVNSTDKTKNGILLSPQLSNRGNTFELEVRNAVLQNVTINEQLRSVKPEQPALGEHILQIAENIRQEVTQDRERKVTGQKKPDVTKQQIQNIRDAIFGTTNSSIDTRPIPPSKELTDTEREELRDNRIPETYDDSIR